MRARRDRGLDSRRRSSDICRHSQPSTQHVQYYYSKLMHPPQPCPCMQQKKCVPPRNFSHAKSLSVHLGAATAMQSTIPPACIFRYGYGPLHVHASLTLRQACRAGRRGRSSEKRLARSLPPTLSPIRPAFVVQAVQASRHASFEGTETALQKSGPRHVRVSVGLTRSSSSKVCLKTGRELSAVC